MLDPSETSMEATMSLAATVPDELESHLLAISCSCGRTLVSATQRGLVAQVASHWRLRHSELIVITASEFVARHAFTAWEGD
jgi:hypothetical protein